MAVQAINNASPVTSQAPRSSQVRASDNARSSTSRTTVLQESTNSDGTPQEEATETYAETLREALAGDPQAIAKLAAERASLRQAQATSTAKSAAPAAQVTAEERGAKNLNVTI